MKIDLKKVLLPVPNNADEEPKMLLGFDYGDDIYHVMAFDFGANGGALGVMREGDNFVARISLDALVAFNREASALQIEGHAG